MANKNPKTLKSDVTAVDVINAITSDTESLNGTPHVYNIGEDMGAGVKATAIDVQASLQSAGEYILADADMANEFLEALCNRIGLVIYEGYTYRNHFAQLEKGEMPFGWTIEDIFVGLVDPSDYVMTSNMPARDIFALYPPDVKAAFYHLNYRKKYRTSTFREQLRAAFLSLNGVVDLVTRIVQALYKSAAWDEELATRYLLSRAIIDGNTQPIQVPEISPATGTQITTIIKGASAELDFMGSGYNRAGVMTTTPVENQYLIITSRYDASYTVEVQSAAFNLDKVAYLGHRVLVRSFSFNTAELDRLKKIFTDENTGAIDPMYKEFTSDELSQLDNVVAMLVDEKFLQIYRNLEAYRTIEDPDKLKWNHWLHIWKVLATSPFANAISFPSNPVGVDNVTVTPDTLSIQKGQTGQLTANVTTTGFAPKLVNWELMTLTPNSYVSQTGVVSVGANETNTQLQVKVTAVYDVSKFAIATITVTG